MVNFVFLFVSSRNILLGYILVTAFGAPSLEVASTTSFTSFLPPKLCFLIRNIL